MKITLELPDDTERLQVSITIPACDDRCVFITSRSVEPQNRQEIKYTPLGLLGGEWSVRLPEKAADYDSAILRKRVERRFL